MVSRLKPLLNQIVASFLFCQIHLKLRKMIWNQWQLLNHKF